MTIIFTILKILGIVLLSILGLIIFLLLCVLFVPIRYSAKGQYADDFSMYARLTWLCHILSVKFSSLNQDANLVVRLFGIPIYDKKKKQEKQRAASQKKRQHRKKKRKAETCSGNNLNDKKQLNAEDKSDDLKKSRDKTENDFHTEDINNSEQKSDNHIEGHSEHGQKNYVNDNIDEKKSDFSSKIKIFLAFIEQKIKMLWKAIRNIEYTFKRIYDRIISAVHRIQFYKKIWEMPKTKRAFQTCKTHLFRIIKNIRPRKVRINVAFGMEDPAVTADILSVYSILFPWIGNSVIVSPDFNEEKINGDFYIRGHVTIFILAWALWAYLFDQDIKSLKECLNKEEF